MQSKRKRLVVLLSLAAPVAVVVPSITAEGSKANPVCVQAGVAINHEVGDDEMQGTCHEFPGWWGLCNRGNEWVRNDTTGTTVFVRRNVCLAFP
ncbi:MAG: hypothetical protein QOF60_1935 [Actinomycetota bacterium]|jgi:hypothetical protein|nr:hypothetical protein [Actinomycetota bacterium]